MITFDYFKNQLNNILIHFCMSESNTTKFKYNPKHVLYGALVLVETKRNSFPLLD